MIFRRIFLVALLLVSCRVDQYAVGDYKTVILEHNAAVIQVQAAIVGKGFWTVRYSFNFVVEGFSPDSLICQIGVLKFNAIIEVLEIVTFEDTYSTFWSDVVFTSAQLSSMGWTARLIE